MKSFGDAAVAAVRQYNQSNDIAIADAWRDAVRTCFPDSPSLQVKGCPRGAFLGLCSAGAVAGIPGGTYTRSEDNRRYAFQAAQLIRRDPQLIHARPELWRRCTAPKEIVENSQLEVVLALWEAGLLARI